jgi:hypothetical protein
MQELGAQALGNQEKTLKPLFKSGSCQKQKRTRGKSLWNLESMKYFHRAKKWKQVYDNKKDMRVH